MKFFGQLRLSDIHIGHILEYQEWRQQPRVDPDGRTRKARGSMINHETNTLAQILRRAGAWKPIEEFYRPLRLPKSRVGCALDPAEQEQLLRVAASKPRWKVAYWGTLLTANTTAGPGELLGLRLRDIQLAKREIYVWEHVKNEYRERKVWLNDTALWAVEQLLARAAELGAVKPDDCLFPHRAHRRGQKSDPTRPMGSWRRAWESLRKKAGMPRLRMYDLRHHAVTKVLENPETSVQTAKSISGQISQRMIDHYSHIGREAQRRALTAAETKIPLPQPDPLRPVGGAIRARVITFPMGR